MQIEDILKAAILESNLDILNSNNDHEYSYFQSPSSASSSSCYSNFNQLANSPQSNKDLNNNDQELLLSYLDFSILNEPSASVLTPSSSELSSSSVSPVCLQQDHLSNSNLMLTDDNDPFLLALKQLDEQNSKLESNLKLNQSKTHSTTLKTEQTPCAPTSNAHKQNRKIIKINSASLNSPTSNLVSYSTYKPSVTSTSTISKPNQPIVRLVSFNSSNKLPEQNKHNDLNNLINFRNNLTSNTSVAPVSSKTPSVQVQAQQKPNNPIKVINLSQMQQKQLQERLISTNSCQIIKIQNNANETSSQHTQNPAAKGSNATISSMNKTNSTTTETVTTTTSSPPSPSNSQSTNVNNIKITKVVSSRPSLLNYTTATNSNHQTGTNNNNVVYFNKTNNQVVSLNNAQSVSAAGSFNKKLTNQQVQGAVGTAGAKLIGNQILTKTACLNSSGLNNKSNTIPKFFTTTTTSKIFMTTHYINSNTNTTPSQINNQTTIGTTSNSTPNTNTHLNVLNSNISRYASQNTTSQNTSMNTNTTASLNLPNTQQSAIPVTINPKYLFNLNNANNTNNSNNNNNINNNNSQSQAHSSLNSANDCFFYEPDEEVIVEEEEELGHAETYANYMPSKLHLGIRHPDPIVETSSLASVEPPDVWYNLKMPESIYSEGALSALQLEAVVYACQKHGNFLPNNHRCGFLIGDGAGVGKGRTIAGIIYENYLLGRKKALWLSVSNDLKYDAQRDFTDIGADKVQVHALNKLKYSKISSKQNSKVKKGVIFSTYSSLIGESQQKLTKKKYSSRLKQLLQWLGGESFDGVIVFDECHKAKNLVPVGSAKPTKTGLAVLELQEKLPNARIVYASATGASEPKNMAYMVRLGLWGTGTPFTDFNDFIQSIEKRGVGAMEIVAMDMKLRGMYMARQLSFSGVTFKVEEIPLKSQYIKMYDDAVKLWVEMKEKFQEALDLIDHDGKLKKTVWGQFWSSHQRFFKYLCMACKVPYVVELAKKALSNNKCVVIGLQSTGEARTLEHLDECGEINDFVSTARGVLQNLVEKHFPCSDSFTNTANSVAHKTTTNSKNSQRVNDILNRLSSYTNNTAQGSFSSPEKSNNTKSKRINTPKKSIKNRSSSISSTSSIGSSIGSSKITASDLNDENDDPFESEFDNEDDDLDSDFSLNSLNENDNQLDLDELVIANNQNNFDMFDLNLNLKSDQNDSGISLDTTKASSQQSSNSKKDAFESDDSDSLFSITKSVSVQALIHKNKQENRKKQKICNEERKKKLRDKQKRKKQNQLNMFQNENEDDEDEDIIDESNLNLTEVDGAVVLGGIEAESESDDDFKLPAKRLKNGSCEDSKKKSDLEEDPFGFSVTTSTYTPKQRPKPTKPHEIGEYIFEMKSDLLNAIRYLGKRLPANTLDELIDLLDGPDHVAEMTGRKGRIVCRANQSNSADTEPSNHFVYEARNETDVPLELMNVVQKERFMNGEKLIAIISEAASSGISLQANRRNLNQCRRVHITIELPWSADRAIQQFGRTHRSNQVSAPEYIFLISQLAGEKRFASTVAKRLESLGALTHGDRRATESRDLSRFNIDNKYGRAALENVIKSICNMEKPLARIPKTYSGDFMRDAREALHGVGMVVSNRNGSAYPEKDYNNINKFLNRLLGCPVILQNAIFNFFSDVLAAVILQAKRTGKWDMGILDLGSNNEIAFRKETKFFVLKNTGETSRRVEMHTVLVERGLSWEKAMEVYKQNGDSDSNNSTTGFYISTQVKNNHRIAILAVIPDVKSTGTPQNTDSLKAKIKNLPLAIYRPNTGLQVRLETPDLILKKYKRVTPIEAKAHWNEQFQKSATECTHVYRQGHCTNIRNCEIGLRTRKFYIVAGSVLTVWTRVENVLCHLTGSSHFRLQIIRVKTNDNQKIVGCVIPTMCLKQVDSLLCSMSSKSYVHNHLSSSGLMVDDDNDCVIEGLITENKTLINKNSKSFSLSSNSGFSNFKNEKFINNKNNNSIDLNDQSLNYDFT